MEMAYYCQQCGKANLITYDNHKFVGACYNCSHPIEVETESLTVNTIIDHRYQIREEIDETQISNLYIATDLASGNLVILRVFCWDFSYSITDAEDFLNTVDSVGAIAVPTHVELIDWGISDDLMFTVWPCENIESLTKLLKHHTTFEPSIAVSICREVAIALENIHYEAGVGHYNLSSHNIYIDGQGKTRFSDAGHAAYLYHDSNFQDAEFNIYNKHYVSPEIAYNWSVPDIRSDMYSLGCCLYAMVTGKLPFGHRGPQSEQDYVDFGLSKPDEYRMGDEFCRLFYGLTEVRPDNRFQSWVDVVKVMDTYLFEEKQLKQASLSGKRRALTTSYNFDLYADVDENLAVKARKKPIKQKKKIMSRGDIRVRMRSTTNGRESVRPRSTASANARRKKNQNQTPVIIISILVFLGVVLFGIMAMTFSGEDQTQVASQPVAVDEKDSGKSPAAETSKPKEVSSAGTKEPPELKASSKTTPVMTVSAEEEYKELTFEIRELTIRKEWDQALALCSLYSGPFKSQVAELQAEINKKKLSYLESTVKQVVEPELKPVIKDTPGEFVAKRTLNDLAETIFNGQYPLALTLIEEVEKFENVNLDLVREALEDIEESRLNRILSKSYAKEVGQQITLVIDGKQIKGTLQEVSELNGTIKVKVDYMSRKLERIYNFAAISPLENVKRIQKANEQDSYLLQFIYLLHHQKYDEALAVLLKYDGLLRKELTFSMRASQNKMAEDAWQSILEFNKLAPELSDNQFVESFKKINYIGGNAWQAKWMMDEFKRRFEKSSYYQDNQLRISLFDKFIANIGGKEKTPDLIVSADAKSGTVTLEEAIKTVDNGGLIRLLPGLYSGNIIIDKKMTLVGASGVVLDGNLSIDDDRVKLKHLYFTEGYLEVHRRVRDVSLEWISFDKSGVRMRGENTNISINNTLMRGLIVGECRQLEIKNSVILDTVDKDVNKRFAIRGFVSGSFVNSIIYSKDSYAMDFDERMDSSLNMKYSMIFGKLGLVRIKRDNLLLNDLSSFSRKAGREHNCLVAEPQFLNPEAGDFRLKDFSPGFLAGEEKNSIGIQYTETN